MTSYTRNTTNENPLGSSALHPASGAHPLDVLVLRPHDMVRLMPKKYYIHLRHTKSSTRFFVLDEATGKVLTIFGPVRSIGGMWWAQNLAESFIKKLEAEDAKREQASVE